MKNQHASLGEALAEKVMQGIGTTKSLVIHTIIFAIFVAFIVSGINTELVMLLLTTGLSIEAIYLSIFIQMSMNKNNKILEEVCEEVVDIQEELKEDDEIFIKDDFGNLISR